MSGVSVCGGRDFCPGLSVVMAVGLVVGVAVVAEDVEATTSSVRSATGGDMMYHPDSCYYRNSSGHSQLGSAHQFGPFNFEQFPIFLQLHLLGSWKVMVSSPIKTTGIGQRRQSDHVGILLFSLSMLFSFDDEAKV